MVGNASMRNKGRLMTIVNKIPTALRRFVLAILVAGAVVSHADFDAGWDAYERGDYAEALRVIQPLAERGNASAQSTLGAMYQFGQGIPQDYQQAVAWYRKAAEQGHSEAQHNLGVMYAIGLGISQNHRQAVVWYRKAAEQGNAYAQLSLGITYANGKDVPQDDVKAYAWLNLAAARGIKSAKNVRDRIRQKMTFAQVARGQALSSELEARITSPGKPPSPAASAEPSGSGSGVVTGDSGYVLTNHHVIDGCARVNVIQAGAPHDAALVAADAGLDLGLLKAAAIGKGATFSAAPRAKLGATVTVAGYPLSGLLSKGLNVTRGNVSALTGLGDNARHLQITAPVQPGNSGGPLLDQAGNVIGMVVSKLDAGRVAELIGDIPQNINFAIKGALIRGFLDIHGVSYRRQAATAELSPERLAERARGLTVAIQCWR